MIRVLIADPDPSSRNALALLLTRRLGAEMILYAEDAKSVNKEIRDFHPCLALIADTLPGFEAPGTCDGLRELYPELRIALLSVDSALQEQAELCKAVFIHKGASTPDILAKLEGLIGNPD